MHNKTRIGRFTFCISKEVEVPNKVAVHLYYKAQLLILAHIDFKIVNVNSHLKEFGVKLFQKFYNAFIA